MPRRARPTRGDPPPKPPAQPSWKWEERCRAAGRWPVAGVDESGRGPLAGPVVAAAVVLPLKARCRGIQDSKLLAEEERERLARAIRRLALGIGIGLATVEEIDSLNILRAAHLAMARALADLGEVPPFALVDGLPVDGLPCPHEPVVDGDRLCVSIAAASIVAKVTRDGMMRELEEEYPGYGFAQHKGYSTPDHLSVLLEKGPSPVHRRSFAPVAAFFQPRLDLSH